MASQLESQISADQYVMLKKLLVSQTESIGYAEIPFIEDLLKKIACQNVLDIGCGEGSFLLKIAEQFKNTQFLGIDHNELAIKDAVNQRQKKSLHNVEFRTVFFDQLFQINNYDAIMTRYTLQHSSVAEQFVALVYKQLKKKGSFIAIESFDNCIDYHDGDTEWVKLREILDTVHKRIGSNQNMGRDLGRLFSTAGFQTIQIRIIPCSPSTVGLDRFQSLVRASTEAAYSFFPDLFGQNLLNEIYSWIDNSEQLKLKDPCLCTAIANGIKP